MCWAASESNALLGRARPDLATAVLLLPERTPKHPLSASHDHLLEIHGETVAIATETPRIFSILLKK
jgi:hypothetical protein